MNNELMEEWRPVVGFEDCYEVSSFGRVRSLDRPSWNGKIYFIKLGQEKAIQVLPNGYERVHLAKDGKNFDRYIHRLVAEAFLDNPLGLPEVNHKDERKTNNRVENLEWCTREYNANYGTGRIRSGLKHKGFISPRRKPVAQYTINNIFVKKFPSATHAAQAAGLSVSSICKAVKDVKGYAGGFVWRWCL